MTMKVAVIGFKTITEVVYSLPLIETFAMQLDAEVVVFTESQLEFIYTDNLKISSVVSNPKNRYWWQTFKRLKHDNFDYCLVLDNSFSSALLAFMSKIPQTIGYAKGIRGLILTHSKKLPKKIMHQLERNVKLGELVGLNARGYFPKISLTEEEKLTQEYMVSKKGLQPDNYMVFILTSTGKDNSLPLKIFSEVAEYVTAKLKMKVVVLGGKDDIIVANDLQQMQEENSDFLNLAGGVSSREMIRFCLSASAVISNYNELMCLASAARVPVITWSISTDNSTKPTSPKTMVINPKVDCQPCTKKTCKLDNAYCLHQLTAQIIQEKIDNIILTNRQ